MKEFTLHVESYADIIDEVRPLLQLHSDEIDAHLDVLVMEPDNDFYRLTEASGRLHVFTIRHEGELIGYSAFIVMGNPHYKGTIFGVNDVLFIKKEHRRSQAGAMLITFAETILRDMHGAVVVTYHSKVGECDITPFLNKFGYEREEYMLSKVV